jgi:glycosyltransferase involved in cell wall biosynthesis
MMRIFYITRANLALRRAHTANIMETVKAFARQGVAVEVVGEHIWRTLVARRRDYDIVYVRDHRLILQACVAKILLGKKLVYEVHSTHGLLFLRRFLFRIADGRVYITHRLKEYYDPQKQRRGVVVHSSGVYLEDFAIHEVREDVRETLGLPRDGYLLVYTGSTRWYDIELLIHALACLPEDVSLVLAGVKEEEMQSLQPVIKEENVSSRVIFAGRVPREKIPLYLFAADVLVNPLSANLPGSVSSKLYEYLAAGRPIVSSRGGANDEVLADGKNALFADMTPESFAQKVIEIREHPDLAARLSTDARTCAARYTWDERAKAILSMIQTIHD